MLGFFSNLLKIFSLSIFKGLKINSLHVSARAIAGEQIKIQRSTVIDSQSEIGSYTYIGSHCFITKSKIGRYCSIANNVNIGQGEHDLKRISTSSLFYKNPYKELTLEDCIVGDDVWIGVGAIILRGVKIGMGSVVAANAVVTKSIPDYAIVAGVPARIIRYRFSKKTIKKIKETKWWRKSLNNAKKTLSAIALD
jgi:virginiamycin A acetyltransferase